MVSLLVVPVREGGGTAPPMAATNDDRRRCWRSCLERASPPSVCLFWRWSRFDTPWRSFSSSVMCAISSVASADASSVVACSRTVFFLRPLNDVRRRFRAAVLFFFFFFVAPTDSSKTLWI